jgi:hypothetical protein
MCKANHALPLKTREESITQPLPKKKKKKSIIHPLQHKHLLILLSPSN